ncbi:MAG: T9SS type A sorting domain-containing protein [Flavobacterium sp.]
MKKLLLLIFSASMFAQTNISFESSESYNLGSIHGQNNWITTGTGQAEPANIVNQVITEEQFTNGTRSLKIIQEAAFPPQQGPIVGAFYNFPVPQNAPLLEISFDIRMTEQTSNSMDVNFLAFSGTAPTLTTALRFVFNFQGLVRTIDSNTNNELVFVNTTAPNWVINTWYNVKMVRNTVDQTVLYYVNNALVYSGSTINNTNAITQMRFAHDNYDGSAFIDNISIVVPTASLPSIESKGISMYPNPAKDILNVTSTNNSITSTIITDSNGRVIKSFNANSSLNFSMDVNDLSVGMYILVISTNDGISASKFIKN